LNFYRDDELPGFAVRVTKRSKFYILEKRFDGINRRITIGKCSSITLEAARKQASIMLGEIAKGKLILFDRLRLNPLETLYTDIDIRLFLGRGQTI